ncbi:MAG: PtsP [Candidatus Tokpelaia sp. JSC161]|jgi:phosphotransferase system enzyme I (PtsP)|nr:MAG: PtsP [Candidatus Tokpelaia sp. JSC161]
MQGNSNESNRLLKRLRALMEDDIAPQMRLDRLVQEIARNMDAEVCSLYILRSDGMLELYASEGLNPKAVHRSELRFGKGLVGSIAATARPLHLVNAQHHKAFSYLPETGEEIYTSFLGVPILRSGRTLGVLVLQNRNQRSYSDDEIELLETLVMVFSEIIASGNLPTFLRSNVEMSEQTPFSLEGNSLNVGISLGYVLLHEPRVAVTNIFNEGSELELLKLSEALDALWLSIDDMLMRRDVATDGEHREVLEAYRMFAHDKGWVKRLEEAIRNGLTAEAAVEKVQSDIRACMIQSIDPYMQERLSDFDDLANRLLLHLLGRHRDTLALTREQNSILVARSMGAVELLDYPREKIAGLVLEGGGATSHVVIVARAMDIPVIGKAKGAFSLLENGDFIIIDAEEGYIHLRPSLEVENAYRERIYFRDRRKKNYRDLRNIPTCTRDGVPITLLMNAGLLVDLPNLAESGAEGIGLFRTELHFMISATFPRAEEQEKLYRTIYKEIGDKSITFRTLDIGGDKIPPYFRDKSSEENPALGWRAIRLTLDRPALMRTQLRAILKASTGRELRIMLPMVTTIAEINQARDLVDRELAHLIRFGYDLPNQIKLGAMIEVPCLLFQLDELMQVVDFVSVGLNDLLQFMMATDRSSSRLIGRFDPLSPAVLRALCEIIYAGKRHNMPVTLCGEMVGSPLTAMALLGLGFRRLSMSSSSIGPVKSMILSLDVGKLGKEIQERLSSFQENGSMRSMLADFAFHNNVLL